MLAAKVPLSASHKDQKPIPATGFALSGLVAWMLLSSQRQSQKSKFREKRLSKTGEKGLTSLLSWRKGSVGTLDAGGHGQGMLQRLDASATENEQGLFALKWVHMLVPGQDQPCAAILTPVIHFQKTWRLKAHQIGS